MFYIVQTNRSVEVCFEGSPEQWDLEEDSGEGSQVQRQRTSSPYWKSQHPEGLCETEKEFREEHKKTEQKNQQSAWNWMTYIQLTFNTPYLCLLVSCFFLLFLLRFFSKLIKFYNLTVYNCIRYCGTLYYWEGASVVISTFANTSDLYTPCCKLFQIYTL